MQSATHTHTCTRTRTESPEDELARSQQRRQIFWKWHTSALIYGALQFFHTITFKYIHSNLFLICTLFEFNAFSRNNVEEVSPETSLQSRQLSLSLSLFTPFYPLSPTPPLTWENEAVPNAPAHMLHKKKIFVFLNNYSCSGEWQQSEWNKKPWLTALRICRTIIEWREMGEDVTNVTAVESAVYFSKKTKVQ